MSNTEVKMKKLMKIILIILGLIAALIVAIFLFLLWSSKQPAVSVGYFNDVFTDVPAN